MSEDLSSRLRSALAGLGHLDTIPQLPHLTLRRCRIVTQGADGRVSLQQVARGLADEGPDLPDMPGALPVWMGVPGVSVDFTPGQEVLLAFARGDGADPVAFGAPPRGFAGAIPIKVRLDATTEIRFVSASAGVVRVGPGVTLKVALAPPVQTMVGLIGTAVAGVALQVTTPNPANLAAMNAAVTALTTAISTFAPGASKLETL